MTAKAYLAQHEKLHGHFYFRHGRYLWDVMWSIRVFGFEETLTMKLEFNMATRYLGNSSCRGRAFDETPPLVREKLNELRGAFSLWQDGVVNDLLMPRWAYGDPRADTRRLFVESPSVGLASP